MIDVSSTCRQPSCFSQQMKLNILETRWVIHSLNGLPRDSLILCPVDSTFLPHTHTHTHSHPSLFIPWFLALSLTRTHPHSLAILFHFLCVQHVSDINISIIRSLRLFCWITALVVLFLVRCVLEFRCGWVGVLSVLQAEALLFYFTSYVLNMFRTLIYPSSGACDYSVELLHWSYCSWFDVFWSFGVVGLEWYQCCRLKQLATPIPLQLVNGTGI